MQEIEVYISITKHIQKLLDDDDYYKEYYKKDFEKVLLSMTFKHKKEKYNVLSMLCFGSEDGNAWIDTTLWLWINDGFCEIGLGEPLHSGGSVTIEYDDICVVVNIDED